RGGEVGFGLGVFLAQGVEGFLGVAVERAEEDIDVVLRGGVAGGLCGGFGGGFHVFDVFARFLDARGDVFYLPFAGFHACAGHVGVPLGGGQVGLDLVDGVGLRLVLQHLAEIEVLVDDLRQHGKENGAGRLFRGGVAFAGGVHRVEGVDFLVADDLGA